MGLTPLLAALALALQTTNVGRGMREYRFSVYRPACTPGA